ncbi:MAG: hypothetical protein PHS59_06200 [Paludibacter sp.]|nr:hypothetical protein [Paludibacter sp.]
MIFRRKKLIYTLLLLSINLLFAQNDSAKISFNGQITAWAVGQVESPYNIQFGGRFVPTLLGDFSITQKTNFDFEVSANINGSTDFTGFQYDTIMGQIKPYRVWGRFSGSNWEIRGGLQKINFGSAKMFRPLMWFDAMDVRDPLQLTDGVYGLLSKYFFHNNANIWLWGLIGNKNPKGYELYGSSQWKPEYGGRFQTPLGKGEIAVSTNFRKVLVPNLASSIPNNDYLLNESRIGLDGKWDVGIGLWFESSVTFTDKKNYTVPTVFNVQDMWNIGADYTFGIGNGLGMTVEYFRYHAGDEFLLKGMAVDVLGTMLTYPISLIDNLSGMFFYLPGQTKLMNYLSWSRTYDNFNIYGIAYWNPDNVNLVSAQSQSRNMFAGKGLQLMLSYNF